jgi:hypothetical protein
MRTTQPSNRSPVFIGELFLEAREMGIHLNVQRSWLRFPRVKVSPVELAQLPP